MLRGFATALEACKCKSPSRRILDDTLMSHRGHMLHFDASFSSSCVGVAGKHVKGTRISVREDEDEDSGT